MAIAFVVLAGMWAGLVLGVSFVATPAKFLAPSITLPVALDVGRATFRVSMLIEFGLGFALIAAGALAFGWSGKTQLAAAILLVLNIQRYCLLPGLDARTTLVIAGTPPPPSWHHLAWIVADAARFLLLLGLCIATLRDVRTWPAVS